jgi:hypothetical protein
MKHDTKVKLMMFGTSLALVALALPTAASATEDAPVDSNPDVDKQTTAQDPEAVLKEYAAKKTFNSRYGYSSVSGRKRFSMADHKGAFGQTFKGANGEAIVIQLGQILAGATDESDAFFANNLVVARLLDDDISSDISAKELSTKLDELVAKGLIASQPDYGYSLAVVYKNGAGQRVQGFVRIDQLPDSDTRFTLDGGASVVGGFEIGGGIRKTTVIDQTATSYKDVYRAFRLGLNDDGLSVTAEIGKSNSRVVGDNVKTDKWSAGVSFSNGVSVGTTYRTVSVDQYTGESRKHFASVGINPGGPSIAAKGDLSDRVSYLAGVNALPLFGGSIPAPGVVVAGLSFKGKPTTWTYNSRHFWYTSSSGNDGKTLVSLGVAGIGGTFIPWILPGDGLYPDRMIMMPEKVEDQERINNIAQEVRETQMAFRNNREALAFVEKRVSGFQGVELFPGRAALYVIPDSQWHGGEFPRVAAAFTEITGVEALGKDGKAIISDDEAFDVMFKWFEQKNPLFAGTFKTPQEVEALKLYLRTHTKLDKLPTPKEAVDMGAATRLHNINTNVFEVDGEVLRKKSRIVTAANGQQTLAMPTFVTVKVYQGARDGETNEEAPSETMTFVYNGSTGLDPSVAVGKQRELLKVALEEGTFDKDGNIVSFGASHVRVIADSILTNANVSNGPSTKYQAVWEARETVKTEIAKMPGWVLLPKGVSVERYFNNTIDAFEKSQQPAEPEKVDAAKGQEAPAPVVNSEEPAEKPVVEAPSESKMIEAEPASGSEVKAEAEAQVETEVTPEAEAPMVDSSEADEAEVADSTEVAEVQKTEVTDVAAESETVSESVKAVAPEAGSVEVN